MTAQHVLEDYLTYTDPRQLLLIPASLGDKLYADVKSLRMTAALFAYIRFKSESAQRSIRLVLEVPQRKYQLLFLPMCVMHSQNNGPNITWPHRWEQHNHSTARTVTPTFQHIL
ncbi:hypothetical protein BsWGS_14309 [Bradybaena similaris]